MSQAIINAILGYRERVTGGVKQIDSDHGLIHAGRVFTAFTKDSVDSGATLVFSFTTPATKYVHYRTALIVPSVDQVTTEIYEGSTINVAGTALVVSNRNRTSATVAESLLKKGTTFTANGTLLPGFSTWLPGTTGIGQARSGTAFTATDEIVLKQGTTYRFVLTNGSSAANIVGITFRWYEEDLG